MSSRCLFVDPLVEDLALLVSLASLGEDLDLPLGATSVVEVVLEAMLGSESVEVAPDLILGGSGVGTPVVGKGWPESPRV